MIVFELSMPHASSWNGKWSGAGKKYICVMDQRTVPKELWDKDFYYRWDDGWEACVSVRKVYWREAQKLEKMSVGFAGYDWMIDSLIQRGYIVSESDLRRGAKHDPGTA